MLGICLLGSGRMGQIYAANVAARADARLVYTVNPNLDSAMALAERFGGTASGDVVTAVEDPDVDAVIISTPTNTHLEQITLAARAGKPILCEKPLDLDMGRVDQCLEVLDRYPVPFALGFNRRFDPSVKALRDAVQAGEVGDLHLLLITSRDPAPPPIEYVKTSGGYFCDSTIHDLDLARWIMGEDPKEVCTMASCLVDPMIGEVGDVDTAMTILRMPSGRLCHINNSRRSVYGFDQRIEAFGSAGMIQTENQREVHVARTDADRMSSRPRLKHFFLERYAEAFALQLGDFLEAIASGRLPAVTQDDGKAALALALACDRSRREGQAIAL